MAKSFGRTKSGRIYAMEVDMIEVTSNLPRPDPNWKYTDRNGHEHHYEDGYPTLKWWGLPCDMGHGDDCNANGFYACAICALRIEPAELGPSAFKEYMPGMIHYSVDDREVTKEEYERLLKEDMEDA